MAFDAMKYIINHPRREKWEQVGRNLNVARDKAHATYPGIHCYSAWGETDSNRTSWKFPRTDPRNRAGEDRYGKDVYSVTGAGRKMDHGDTGSGTCGGHG